MLRCLDQVPKFLDWDSPAAMRGRPAQPIKPLIVDMIAETEEDLLLPTNLE